MLVDHCGIGMCGLVADGCRGRSTAIARVKLAGYWLLNETNLLDGSGSPPIAATNLTLVESLEEMSVELHASGRPAVLRYSEMQSNGWPNLYCHQGAVFFWFKLNEMPTNTYVPLIEVGIYTENASNGWWSFYWQDNALTFAAQTNGSSALYLEPPLTLESNQWYQIVLNYTPTNSELYINDNFVTNGSGVSLWPSASVRSNGLCFFNDGTSRSLDCIITLDGPLCDWEISDFYTSFAAMENQIGNLKRKNNFNNKLLE